MSCFCIHKHNWCALRDLYKIAQNTQARTHLSAVKKKKESNSTCGILPKTYRHTSTYDTKTTSKAICTYTRERQAQQQADKTQNRTVTGIKRLA